ncbi:uncharacterized protein E0L32_005106 [Thyridium curvatum]|uniref:Kinesin motor domain-containing protein n=1 Tax=Thyridium curvatum TaxID=1093900 RepID=A0A507BCN5_9PEZI|nr:uncharacterized protein E0L32_005106 [Thyridium curvatum]TPX14711.1 hypothetical protein E0L32_005106 [Thyridium curvatum]
MRGGLRLAERGVIPRLLSHVFRRGKKIAKDSAGETAVDVALSYYEIYNDKVFDLLEPPEKRTPSGLPLREKDGKTVVVGLSERSCGDLKDFERLYIEANNNRVTAATKLNAHSSRSHAILRVKVTQVTGGDMVLESTASAIDLAGSEDNRRTDNGRERLVESAAINKSLFVLSQCVDAISRGEKRVPYRESKMTRILSLGQNNGITVMILNLAPLRSYHLDTLSSLNVSSRAKRIEVREIENEIVFKQQPPKTASSASSGGNMARQPLRPLANAHNMTNVAAASSKAAAADKPAKAFSVYTDRSKPSIPRLGSVANTSQPRRSTSIKRPSDSADLRPTKMVRPSHAMLSKPAPPQQQQQPPSSISADQIEAIIERKVQEALAARAQAQAEAAPAAPAQPLQSEISEAVQRRLEALERRIDDGRHDDGRSEGLRFLLAARQHKERGDDEAALRHYEMALPFFPGQVKLLGKIEKLRAKLAGRQGSGMSMSNSNNSSSNLSGELLGEKKKRRANARGRRAHAADDDDDYEYDNDGEADVDDESFVERPARPSKAGRKPRVKASKMPVFEDGDGDGDGIETMTPRKRQLLAIVNSRDVSRIRGLAGFGAKKARDLVDYLELLGGGDEAAAGAGAAGGRIESVTQLRSVPGMGGRTVERAYEGLTATAAAAAVA